MKPFLRFLSQNSKFTTKGEQFREPVTPRKAFPGQRVRLENPNDSAPKFGTLVLSDEANSAPLDTYGVWTITLESGNRYRNEGRLYLP